MWTLVKSLWAILCLVLFIMIFMAIDSVGDSLAALRAKFVGFDAGKCQPKIMIAVPNEPKKLCRAAKSYCVTNQGELRCSSSKIESDRATVIEVCDLK